MSAINIYGVPFSQPVRAVVWLLLQKEHPFQLVPTNPGSKGEKGSRHPSYLAKNPSGTIPCLEETDTGYALGEAHAIMAYLCQSRGWTDLYPDDPQSRGKVDWYLNFHHRNIRDASSGMVAPKIRKDLDIPDKGQSHIHVGPDDSGIVPACIRPLHRRRSSDHCGPVRLLRDRSTAAAIHQSFRFQGLPERREVVGGHAAASVSRRRACRPCGTGRYLAAGTVHVYDPFGKHRFDRRARRCRQILLGRVTAAMV